MRRVSKDERGSYAPHDDASPEVSLAPHNGIIVDVSLPQVLPHSPAAASAPTRLPADQKTEYLDGVRGIMCLVVLCDHWLMMGYYDRPASAHADPQKASPFFAYALNRSPIRIFVAGEFAVATFFVLRCFFDPHYL